MVGRRSRLPARLAPAPTPRSPASSGAPTPHPHLRLADADDLAPLRHLAALGGDVSPHGRVLVAEVGGELWAAVGLEDWRVVRDPRRPTSDLAAEMVVRARRFVPAERADLRRRTSPWRRAADPARPADALC